MPGLPRPASWPRKSQVAPAITARKATFPAAPRRPTTAARTMRPAYCRSLRLATSRRRSIGSQWSFARRSGGLRRHDDGQRQPPRPGVPDGMLLAGRRAHEVAGAHVALLGADADPSGAVEHVVELVADCVSVARLFLAGLEAVRVAEEVRRVDEPDLLHLVRAEGDQRGDMAEALHTSLLQQPGRAGTAADAASAREGLPTRHDQEQLATEPPAAGEQPPALAAPGAGIRRPDGVLGARLRQRREEAAQLG